jgi:hypothetical protein
MSYIYIYIILKTMPITAMWTVVLSCQKKRSTSQTDMFSNNATYSYEMTTSKMTKIFLVVRTPHTNRINMWWHFMVQQEMSVALRVSYPPTWEQPPSLKGKHVEFILQHVPQEDTSSAQLENARLSFISTEIPSKILYRKQKIKISNPSNTSILLLIRVCYMFRSYQQ